MVLPLITQDDLLRRPKCILELTMLVQAAHFPRLIYLFLYPPQTVPEPQLVRSPHVLSLLRKWDDLSQRMPRLKIRMKNGRRSALTRDRSAPRLESQRPVNSRFR